MPSVEKPKHRQIYEFVHDAIKGGKYGSGERIPGEAELGLRFSVSRPTVSRALRDLEREGYLIRRPGAGTFVSEPRSTSSGMLGIIIPHAETGICAEFCAEISHAAEAQDHVVLFGSVPVNEGREQMERAEAFCERFIARRVAGVFFVALEVKAEEMHCNEHIVERFERAGIPVVLLDRDICDYPRRSNFALVGIDNRRAGYVLTEHLLRLGCRRIHFVDNDWVASTATQRLIGYKEALAAYDIRVEPGWIHRCNPRRHTEFVHELTTTSRQAEALVCVNDTMARSVMHNLAVRGIRIPEDVRIVGVDDLPFAARLPVPLTTLRQPVRHLASHAVAVMEDLITNPEQPAQHVMIECELKVRQSCGAALTGDAEVEARGVERA